MAVVIKAIIENVFVILFVIALFATYAKVHAHGRAGARGTTAYVLWGEVLFFNVGLLFVYYGVLHAYFQQIAAPSIGWAPSPFEFELGWIEIPVGIVAILSLWRGYEFRLASTIIFATFSLAAAAGHVSQIMCCHNYAPNNAGLLVWFNDVFVPLLLIVCAVIATRSRKRLNV